MSPSAPALRAAIDHYARHHQNPVNRALHFFGIPVIAAGLLGLLAKLSLDVDLPPALRPNLAWPALLGAGLRPSSCWTGRAGRGGG
jgi:hypothetical protein